MKNIPVQADNLTSLAAADFNEIPRESENAIQASGQTLTSSDLQQIAKALAIYSGCGDAYADSGYSSTYILSPTKVNVISPAYYLGMKVRFKPLFANTSTSCTVNVNSLGATAINVGQLANGGTPSVPAQRIVANKLYVMVYDVTQDGLTYYFRMDQVSDEMVESVSLDKLIAGETDITVSNDRLRLNAEYMNFNDTSTGASMTIKSGSGSDNAFSYSPSVNGRRSTVHADGVTIRESSAATYRAETTVSGKGVSFRDGPGDFEALERRTDGYIATSWTTWSVDSVTSRIFYCLQDLTLTGIPWNSIIYNATLTYISSGGQRITAPVRIACKNVGGVTTIDSVIALVASDPSSGTDQQLWIDWYATTLI